MGSANVQPVVNGQVPRWRVHSAIRIGIDLSPMKLTVKKEWPSIPSDSFLLQTASLQDGTLLALCVERGAARAYSLLVIQPENAQVQQHPLPYVSPPDRDDRPVLFASGMVWGCIVGGCRLFLHTGEGAESSLIRIDDPQRLYPPHAHLLNASVLAAPGHPVYVSLERAPTYTGDARHFAELRWSAGDASAHWSALSAVQPSADCPASPIGGYTPKLEGLMSARESDDLYAFIPGSDIGSPMKHGMRYWALVRMTPRGDVVDVLLRGGNTSDGKRQGVNCVFTSTGDHAILTPMFATDDWGGKQRLFSIAQRTSEEVTLPRGKSKYRLIQQSHSGFWIWRHDEGQISIALCQQAP